ncbi:MAG TPA: enolase C-terminal domain-like protein [Acidimicrobiales bacterium]|nr:enolase C-terminal domain-like protein [Acidimicrobiales bacterium]
MSGTGPPPVAVTLHRVRLPLRAPHVAAHGREDGREVVLVGVTDDDGVVGWGECPALSVPGYAPEWIDGAWWVLSRLLGPAVLAGRGADGVPGHPMASGAVRDALLDLRLRQAGEGPASALGPLAPTVAFGVAVGLDDDPDRVAAAAAGAVAAGASLVVVKVRPGWAAVPLAAARDAAPGVAVAVDANGSFTEDDIDELRALDRLGPAFVEQPLPAEDLVGSARLSRALDAPVALDEAVTGPGALEAAVALGAGAILTVKPARAGGVEAAAALVVRAAAAGWGVHAGGMLESGVGRAAARAVAALPAVAGPALLGSTHLLFTADVVAPAPGPAPRGRVAVHPGPGLVPAPDPERLAELAVATWHRSR